MATKKPSNSPVLPKRKPTFERQQKLKDTYPFVSTQRGTDVVPKGKK